jgi:hypothetical protein
LLEKLVKVWEAKSVPCLRSSSSWFPAEEKFLVGDVYLHFFMTVEERGKLEYQTTEFSK